MGDERSQSVDTFIEFLIDTLELNKKDLEASTLSPQSPPDNGKVIHIKNWFDTQVWVLQNTQDRRMSPGGFPPLKCSVVSLIIVF